MGRKSAILIAVLAISAIIAPTSKAQEITPGISSEPEITHIQTTGSAKARLDKQLLIIKNRVKTEAKLELAEAIKQKRLELKEIIASKQAEFKEKLKIIRDEKKKLIVTNINTKLAELNTKHTDRYIKVLENLQKILDAITNDADKVNAQQAIETAKTAVEAQATKIYSVTITTEETLRINVGQTISQLNKDLSTTYKTVITAKQAVQALRPEPAMKKEATDSAKL